MSFWKDMKKIQEEERIADRKFEAFQRGYEKGKIRGQARARASAGASHTNIMGGKASFRSGGIKGFGLEWDGITAEAGGRLGTHSYIGADAPASMTLTGYDGGEEGGKMEVEKFQGGTATGEKEKMEVRLQSTPVIVTPPPWFTQGRESATGRFSGMTTNVSPELKFFDTTATFSDITPSGVVGDSINKIPQGITEDTRIGRKCTIVQIHWRMTVGLGNVTAQSFIPTSDVIRVIMYQDKQANGAAAVITDFLETVDPYSFRNLANTRRFHTIHDETYTLNRNTNTAFLDVGNDIVYSSTRQVQWIEVNKKVHIPLEFDGATGAITEICSNNVGIIVLPVGDAENQTFIISKIRVRYSDM